MRKFRVVLVVLGIGLVGCGEPSSGAKGGQGGNAGTGASGESGVPGDPGEGGSSGTGFGGNAGTGTGGTARGGSDERGGTGGDAGASGDGSIAGTGGDGDNGGSDGGGTGGAGGSSGATSGMGGAGVSGAGAGGAGTGGAGMGGAGTGGAGTGGGPSCSAERCLSELGANPCGAWSCSARGACVVESAACVDRDGDGLGVGTSCACGLDCDDNDSRVTGTKTIPCCRTGTGTKTCTNGVWQACTAGIPATAEACDGEDDDCDGVPDDGLGEFTCGMGVCKRSVPACAGGEVSTCVPGPPASAVDGCNGLDDDCDGAVDEDCSSCLHVTPDGNDATAASSGGLTPFRNVQPAIDFAAAHRSVATRVCVAGGSACSETATYPGPSGTELTMRNGIDVLGGYESRTWTRCTTTRLAPTTGLGVLFPETIAAQTVLDGFSIDRFAATTTAGVSVRGGRGVLLSNLRIESGPDAMVSYGVNVTAGGEVTVFRSHIDGGQGTEDTVGVRSVASRVFLEDSCSPLTGGRCEWTPVVSSPPSQSASCNGAWVRGWPLDWGPSVRGTHNAVRLEDSPGSRVERSAVCSFNHEDSTDPSAIHVLGDGSDVVVRASSIAIARSVENGRTAALRLNDCRGAAPWIVDNHSILNSGNTEELSDTAIHAFGDCHPVIDTNQSIVLRASAAGAPSAVTCGTPNGTASRCVIVNNARIATESTGSIRPSLDATGVACNGCVKVARNAIFGLVDFGGNSCGMGCEIWSRGLSITSTEALIDRNHIVGGCALAGSATGLYGSGNLRIQNNVIGSGNICSVSAILRGPFYFAGLSLGSGFADVHSNYIDGGNPGQVSPTGATSCSVTGFASSGQGGIVRNNRILAGLCTGSAVTTDSAAFREATTASDPGVFENNSLALYSSSSSTGNQSYLDEGTTRRDALQVNALGDMTASGNIGPCTSTGAVLVSGSVCIDAGTQAGAPLVDIDGDPRRGAPDIGPDEF